MRKATRPPSNTPTKPVTRTAQIASTSRPTIAPLARHIVQIQDFLAHAHNIGPYAVTTEAYVTLRDSMTDRVIAWSAHSPTYVDPDNIRGFVAQFLHGIAERHGQVVTIGETHNGNARRVTIGEVLDECRTLAEELTDPCEEAHTVAECPVRTSAA
jgi:hypothetical protein